MSERMLLFIPAYNCEKQIVRVLNQLDKRVLAYFEEVLVVNNRSTDNTEKVVLEFLAEHPEKPVKLMRNTENYGLGGSQKMAFHYAIDHGYDYVACYMEMIRVIFMIFCPCLLKKFMQNMIVY